MSIFMRSWRDGTEAFAWNIRHKSGVTPQGIYVCRSAKEKGQAVNPIWDDSLFGRRKNAVVSEGQVLYEDDGIGLWFKDRGCGCE